MNANPFTFGHQYLVRLAASQCDWLHVFVVREDVSQFSYRDRYALVKAGVAGIPNLTLHHGSEYMVSRAPSRITSSRKKAWSANVARRST